MKDTVWLQQANSLLCTVTLPAQACMRESARAILSQSCIIATLAKNVCPYPACRIGSRLGTQSLNPCWDAPSFVHTSG